MNSLGNKDVLKFTAAGGSTPVELDANDILNNMIVEVTYDGTQFIVTSSLATGSGSPYVFLETITPTSGQTIRFTNVFDSTYEIYKLVLSGITVDTDDAYVFMELGTGAGPTWQTSSYDFFSTMNVTDSTNLNTSGTSQA